uniref:Uncharacterized protein n=1 Tax=Astyanax mexicanus TaxID=7994 RepID=A0A8B9KEP1_ASTMX
TCSAPPCPLLSSSHLHHLLPMEMGSKSSLPDEDLLCCVCFDVFTDPVLLSCTHSVCRTCLQGFWESKGSRECPVCRRRSSKEDPTLNRALKNLCDAFQERKNRGGSAGGSEVVCSLHREKLGFFCLDDQKPVCAVCQTSVRHTNHKFLSAEEAVAELKFGIYCTPCVRHVFVHLAPPP